MLTASAAHADDLLGGLARPHEGRSMRATSTFREGRDGKYDPRASPKGDREEASNRDNFRVAPGATHVLYGRGRPGEITHIWLTFLGPEPQEWAKNGSANHQEMLLRIYWDGRERPGVEAPVGDFFANCFGQRQRGEEPPGRRRGCRLLQLLLADAVSQVGPDRDRQSERKADQPALLQYRLDQEAEPRRRHALFPCPVLSGISGPAGQ